MIQSHFFLNSLLGFLGYLDVVRLYKQRLGARPNRNDVFEKPLLFDIGEGSGDAAGVLYWYCDRDLMLRYAYSRFIVNRICEMAIMPLVWKIVYARGNLSLVQTIAYAKNKGNRNQWSRSAPVGRGRTWVCMPP